MGADRANDIWGWTDPATGREYALVGLVNGVGFVDLGDPEKPVVVGRLPTRSAASSWRDLKVHDDHLFVVSEARDHGLQVFDLKALRDVDDPPAVFTTTADYDGFGSAHNLAINETVRLRLRRRHRRRRRLQRRAAHDRPPAARGAEIRRLLRRRRLHPRRPVRVLRRARPRPHRQGDLLRRQRGHADHRRRDRQGPAGAAFAHRLCGRRLHPPGLAERRPPLLPLRRRVRRDQPRPQHPHLCLGSPGPRRAPAGRRLPGRDRRHRPQPVHPRPA